MMELPIPKRRKLVRGVGINDADYVTQTKKPRWICPYYVRWSGMLRRCYSDSYHASHPSYRDCSVCDEWQLFSNFRQWVMEQEQIHGSLDGLQLDKDIIDPTNKIYSSDKCAFVTQIVNLFVTDSSKSRGQYPIGVSVRKSGRIQAQCNDPFNGVLYLGNFDTQEQAHEAWRKQKNIFAYQLADICVDQRVALALRLKYKQ